MRIMLLTNDQFNQSLDDFNDILVNNLDIAHPSTILQNKVYVVNDQKLLNLILKYDKYVITFVISYDKFFQVPILHFQVQENKGEFDELVLMYNIQDIKFLKGPPLILDNHNLLPGTWFLIHPCETLAGVDRFLNDSGTNNTTINYLITWNALYGLGTFNDFKLKYKTI